MTESHCNDRQDIWDNEICDDELLSVEMENAAHDSSQMPSMQQTVTSMKGFVPLTALRGGYLRVTDLTAQLWCEQQLWLGLILPLEPTADKPEMIRGSELHFERELQVHSLVDVEVTTHEDSFAVRVLNLFCSLEGFLRGIPVAREVPIFGCPFEQDIFVMGIIDELRFSLETFELTLSEFKTRSAAGLPGLAQQSTHNLQVMLYKTMFDSIASGSFVKESVSRHLGLDLNCCLGTDVSKHIAGAGLRARTLGELLDVLVDKAQYFPRVAALEIEYQHQATCQHLGKVTVDYDDVWLESKFVTFAAFWRGQRQACGVDIEESWKCQKCDFADVCEWRERQASKYSSRPPSIAAGLPV